MIVWLNSSEPITGMSPSTGILIGENGIGWLVPVPLSAMIASYR